MLDQACNDFAPRIVFEVRESVRERDNRRPI
jgi:hypothetical protein